jgi:outer membrane protein assembly factor BamB
MATTVQPSPTPKKTSALRRRFPLFVLAFVALTLGVITVLRRGDTDALYLNLAAQSAVALAGLLLLFWLAFFAPFRRAVRLRLAAVPVLLLAAFVGCLYAGLVEADFSGDMLLHFRWGSLYLNLTTLSAVGLAGLLLVVWLLFFAPFRREIRLRLAAVPVLLLAAFVGCLYAGLIEIDWRWGRQLAQEASGTVPRTEDLSGTGANDFPGFLGRNRDGVVNGPALNTDWSASEPRRLWRKPVGAGHSSFAVAGNVAYTLEQRGNREAVVCYDAATGEAIWIHSYPARFMEALGGLGPRSTPTVSGGEVYTLGATGKLLCLDAYTGKVKWPADVLGDNANVTWGLSGSPLVLDDVVVVNPGAQSPQAAGTLVAYDRKTGERKWVSGRGKAGYSSPMLTTLGGTRQILLFDGQGFSGYDPADQGKQLWRHPWPVQEDINVSQPVVLGPDRVYISSGYGVGGAALEVKKEGGQWSVKPVWKNRKMRCKFSSPVLHEGYLYGLDDGVLVCLDADRGERQWRGERYGHGQLLLTQGLLVITSEQGELILVEASPKQYRELGRVQAVSGRTWNVPALAGGRVFVRNHLEMTCFDLKAQPR